MKRVLIIFALTITTLCTFAQRDPKAPEVLLEVADSMFAVRPSTTQTVLKKGWNIVGFEVGDKTIRYLWGRQSKQLCENRRPRFSIQPQECTLNDFAIIKLKVKRDYRQLPKAILEENTMIRIEPGAFSIEMKGEDTFIVQPTGSMQSGEYILLNTKQKPINEEGDMQVYAFTIQ